MAEAKASDRVDVCVIGLRGFPGVSGGIETHCEQIFTRLSRTSGLRFLVLGRQGYVNEAHTLNERLEVRPVAAVRNKYLEALPNAIAGLFHAVFTVRPRVVHVHAIGPALITPLAKLMGQRVVVTHHGRDYARAKWNWLGRTALKVGEQAALRFADGVIAVSPSLAEELKRDFPSRSDRIHYVPNGAELYAEPSDAEAVLERFGLTAKDYVLGVGRLVPEKCFDDLVEAFERAPPTAKLVIAGNADHADEYVRTLMARGSDRVIFTGSQDRRTLEALYRNASLFVLPSAHEGLPIVVLEALGAGAPVLLSDISANKDIGLPARNYFVCRDVDALVSALNTPHASYAADRDAVLARFDWDAVAAQTLAIYETVMSEGETQVATSSLKALA